MVRLRPDHVLVAGRRAVPPQSGKSTISDCCDHCENEKVCRERVQVDMALPVLCEYIDKADVQRARMMHGPKAGRLLGIR